MSATNLPNKLDALLGSGWTYKVIAERAKCDISTIFRIRNGQIGNLLRAYAEFSSSFIFSEATSVCFASR